MPDLKGLYKGLGFSEISTYIQSGNVAFYSATEENEKTLSKKVEQEIFNKYKFEVPVIIRTIDEIEKIISQNPFVKKDNAASEKLHLTFLSEIPSISDLEKIKRYEYPPDKYEIIGKEVYIYCSDKYHKTKLSNKFFETKLNVSATTRNWKTVNKLLEIAKEK